MSEPVVETLNVPSYVPETMRAMNLLRRFLSAPQGLAKFQESSHSGPYGKVITTVCQIQVGLPTKVNAAQKNGLAYLGSASNFIWAVCIARAFDSVFHAL